jgi:hypothetical protein
VRWDDQEREGVDAALNEADVLGVRLESSGAWCDLLLHVLALPEAGPIDPDARRVLRLTSPTRVAVLLREERVVPRENREPGIGYGPVIPLAGMAAAEEFFASLTWSGSMYGWKFLDDPSLTRDWPAGPSLAIDIRPGPGSHSLYWFNECGTTGHGEPAAYCIEGTVTFEDLAVLRADGTPEPISEFVAGADRYWRALHGRDERLNVPAQRAAQDGTPSWRAHLRNSVTISGPADPGTG